MPAKTEKLFLRIHNSVFGHYDGLASNLYSGCMSRELRYHHFAFVQLLRVMEFRILTTGQSDDLYSVFLRLYDKVIPLRLLIWFHHDLPSLSRLCPTCMMQKNGGDVNCTPFV